MNNGMGLNKKSVLQCSCDNIVLTGLTKWEREAEACNKQA